jgi:uncharacterized membrane protein
MTERTSREVHVRRSTIIAAPSDRLFEAWRDFARQAEFTFGAEAPEVLGAERARWTVRVPGLGVRTWEAELVEARAGESVSWRTVGETALPHEATAHLIPAADGAGTVVTLEVRAMIPRGPAWEAEARITARALEEHVAGTLHNLTQLMERGAVPRPRRTPRDVPSRAARGRVVAAAVAGVAAASFVALRRRRVRARPMTRLRRALGRD